MAKTQGERGRTILPARGAPPSAPEPHEAHEPASVPPELILDGQRYRLVPVKGGEPSRGATAPTPAELLTARELQIVALVAEGRVNKQIGAKLRISEWTVATHLRRIFAKLGVDTRAAMVSRCGQALGNGHPREGV